MTRSVIEVQLAYTVRKRGLEPHEKTLEWPITEYKVGQSDSVPGNAILGLQVKQREEKLTYMLHRLKGAVDFDFDEDGTLIPVIALFKIRWQDPTEQLKPVTASYFSPEHKIVDDGIEDVDDMKFLLKQDANDASVHRLVHVIPSGPGAVDPCVVLEDSGVDCQNPASEAEEVTCEINICS